MSEGNFINPDVPAKKHLALDSLALMSWTINNRAAFGKMLGEADIHPDPNLEFIRKSNRFRVGPFLLPQKLQELSSELTGPIKEDAVLVLDDVLEKGDDSLYQLGVGKNILEKIKEMGINSISGLKATLKTPDGKYFDYDTGKFLQLTLDKFTQAADIFSKTHDQSYGNLAQIPLDELHHKYPINYTGDVSKLKIKARTNYLQAFSFNSKIADYLSELYASGVIDTLEDLTGISDRELLRSRGMGINLLRIIREKYPFNQ